MATRKFDYLLYRSSPLMLVHLPRPAPVEQPDPNLLVDVSVPGQSETTQPQFAQLQPQFTSYTWQQPVMQVRLFSRSGSGNQLDGNVDAICLATK